MESKNIEFYSEIVIYCGKQPNYNLLSKYFLRCYKASEKSSGRYIDTIKIIFNKEVEFIRKYFEVDFYRCTYISCRINLQLGSKASFVRTDIYLTDEHHTLKQDHDL